MATTKIKIPKQLYVTLKEQSERDYTTGVVTPLPPLGFHIEYLPGKAAFDKRKESAVGWAYGKWAGQMGFEQNGLMYVRKSGYEYDPILRTNVLKPQTDELVAQDLQPRIILNDPISGFKISKSVSRYSTSNKLWRILDPRGFELEISTDAMEEILMEGSVVKGEIQGSYQWASTKKLVAA